MVTYNHAPYIAQAIEGVLQQETSFPFELVIGEDYSTDGTREIVFDYQKKYPDIIRVVTSSENVGSCKNNIRTEKACRGKYIAYCEGDDYWHHPQKLQKQVDHLENHPECGLVFSDGNCFYIKTGRLIKNYRRYKRKTNNIPDDRSKLLIEMLRGKLGILTCTVMVRRSLLNHIVDSDRYLYQNDKFLMGDTQRWAEISQVSRLACLDESLATYNILIESATKSRDLAKVFRMATSAGELCVYLAQKYGLQEGELKPFRKYLWRQSLRLAFYEISPQLAEDVKRSKQKLSLKDWLLYWGSQSRLLNFALRPVIRLNKHIKNCFFDEDNY